MNDTKNIRWTRFTNACDDCHRRFRISFEDLEEQRDTVREAMGTTEVTDADIAAVISMCHRCIYGDEGIGEFIDENPHARRWDPKGWALDTLAKAMKEMALILREALENRGSEKLTVRARRRAFVAEALRDRIDGRF